MRKTILSIAFIVSFASSYGQTQNILLEWYTTTPTPFATDGYAFAELLRNNYNVIDVGIHAGYNDLSDAMHNSDAEAVSTKFYATGTPQGMLNRTTVSSSLGLTIGRENWESYTQTLSQQPVLAEVEINNSYNKSSRKVDVSVEVDYLDNINQETRLYMYLVEDSVIGTGSGYDQRNYYNNISGHKYYAAGDPIKNFPHRNVMRQNILGLTGYSFGSNISKGTTKKYNTSITIPTAYRDKQVYIVAFVGYYNTTSAGNEVLNVSKESVIPDCEIDFSYSITNQTATFTNKSKNYTSLEWQFGDGQTSTDVSPKHTYNNGGSYNVTLTLYNGSETCQQQMETIFIPYQCEADFSYSATKLKVDFTNLSSGDADSYLWDFDDGFISNNENPSHTFSASGTYQVTLTTRDPDNDDCDEKTVSISVSDVVCKASFNSKIEKKKLTCTNNSSGNYKSVKWNFGDGNSSTLENPVYTYTNAGTYTVELELYDSQNNLCDATSQTITINDDNNDCNAEFAYSINKLEVAFNNKSSGGYEKTWWDFGDGFLSTVNAPTHTYAKAGSYNSCLALTKGSDTCHQKCVEIEVTGEFIGIDEPSNLIELSIYPNPNNGEFSISSSQIIEQIRVYNMQGLEVDQFNQMESLSTLKIGHLGNGVYHLRVIFKDSAKSIAVTIK